MTDWFQIGKGVCQGCISSPCLINLYYLIYITYFNLYYCLINLYIHHEKHWAGGSTSWNQAGIKIAGRNINNFRYADDTTLMAESEEWKSLLMKVREWKSWLKAQHSENWDHGIRSHHFLANRWGNRGNSGWLYFSGLQNHCRRWLQPWN